MKISYFKDGLIELEQKLDKKLIFWIWFTSQKKEDVEDNTKWFLLVFHSHDKYMDKHALYYECANIYHKLFVKN